MNYEIVDVEPVFLANWQSAMPRAKLLRRTAAQGVGPEVAIRWCRLRTGETLSAILPALLARQGRTVVLADEPSDALTLEALSSGAAGCCNTHAAPEVLVQVATVVENGGLWVGQNLLQQLIGSTTRILSRRNPEPAPDALPDTLSEREKQVAHLVAAGSSNKEIANRLNIAERTVKAHMTTIFDKTGVRDRLQLSLKVNGLKL